MNIFRLLLQLMNVVEQLAASAANYNHGGPGPTNSTFSSQSQQAAELATALSPIIE
ncbi:hypothetical protein [Aeromonas veronii]|uniref:hypothetical protein n=1 Tax=Aeromonas veronii TaxID=654 RepID=UPI0015C667CD|nr:hypothetical protein [Aeromonas veronii]